MKNKLQTLVVAAMIVCSPLFSKTTSFNGSTWNNGAPSGSSDVVTITGGSFSLPANITYSSLTLNGGNLNTNGKTFSVTAMTLTSGTFTSAANQTVTTLNLGGGSFNVGANTLTATNVNVTGGSLSLSSNMTVSTTLTLNGGSLTVNGKTLTVNNVTLTSGTLSLGGTVVNPSGNLTLSGGTLNMGGAAITLGGNISVTANSSIVSTGLSRMDATGSTLTINGGTLTLNNAEVVIDDLTFSTGHDINGTNGGFLSFDNSQNHTLTSVDNTSHVNAKVRLYTANGNSNVFLFPIGDGTVYAPFSIDPNNVPNSGTAFTHYFEATYVGTESTHKVMDLTTLNSVSGFEYWNASASSSSVNGTIALRYDNNATKTGKTSVNSVTNIGSDLILAQYINSKWTGMGSSRAAAGGITTVSSSSNTISPNTSYTLASNNSRTLFIIPLPVTLVNFDAVANNETKSVELKWATTSEMNSSHFEVLHSSDFVNWTTIGTVNSNGSSNLNEYTFNHLQPSAVNHYKLKEVATNGQFVYSDIKLVRLGQVSTDKIKVYPNPSVGTINITNAGDNATYDIVDFTGKVIMTGNFNQSIEMQDLPKGIYTLKVVCEGIAQTERIIVQ